MSKTLLEHINEAKAMDASESVRQANIYIPMYLQVLPQFEEQLLALAGDILDGKTGVPKVTEFTFKFEAGADV